MNIYIASDHTGVDFKKKIIEFFNSKNINIVDCGPFNNDKVSYAFYGKKLAEVVKKDKKSIGIGLCGTGIGISIAVNRIKGIRGARIVSNEDAILAKEHNDANILLFGARQLEINKIIEMIEIFLSKKFEGERHISRINELDS
ncbi:MAG: RpiB/LacA/LacB family sugar-phosphate isomerase [Metamycoplasmataceae bacterium]